MTTYLVLMYLVSLALAYVLAFTHATLTMGRSLSDAGTATGYQDAITHPKFSTVALLVYGVCVAGAIYGVWAFGWLFVIGTAMGLLVAASLNMALILPKSNSEHFRKLIVHSMINRHADYLKSGDTLRASVMAGLLEKAGLPVNKLVAQRKAKGDA